MIKPDCMNCQHTFDNDCPTCNPDKLENHKPSALYTAYLAEKDKRDALRENARLQREVAELRKALEKIANPIGCLQREADEKGAKLNISVAIALANNPCWLNGIAIDALQAYDAEKDARDE